MSEEKIRHTAGRMKLSDLEAENERLKADVDRLRQQNHEAAGRFQKQITELERRLLPDSYEMQERERIRAFLNMHPNAHDKKYWENLPPEQRGIIGYSAHDRTAVVVALRMHDEIKATNAALVEALNRYGVHDYDCSYFIHSTINPPPDQPCSCGFDEALRKAKEK